MNKSRVLLAASVASMIDQFNMPNIRLLLEMGYEVHVACNFKEGNTCDESRVEFLLTVLKDLGVVIYQWDCPRNVHAVTRCYRAYWQMKRILADSHVEWMHCQSPIGGVLARIAAYETGIPVVYTAHGFHFYKGAPWRNWLLYYPVEKLLAGWTDVLITVNKEDYCFARQHLHVEKVFRIPGVGINTETFCNPLYKELEKQKFCRKYHIPYDAFVLLSVGELNKGKNHRMVIDALAAMKRMDVYYLICGQGELREQLQQYADKCGVGRQVRMPGYQTDVAGIYRNADVFVFPSVREGMPVALMEAMAAGLPCVVSDIRGNRELVDHFRFSPDQPKQLLNALQSLLHNTDLRRRFGRYNQIRIKAYDQVRVNSKMKYIYHGFQICLGNGCGQMHGNIQKFMEKPLVSVIIPVFHLADDPVLQMAIESILDQTYQNWEMILCDDGSTDGTIQVLQRLAALDHRIRVVRNSRNRGAGYARNLCLRFACGKYIALMDADDISHPQRLAKQVAFLERHPEYAFVGCNIWLRDRHGIWGRRRMEQIPDRKSFLCTLPFAHPTVMLREEIIRELHGYTQAPLARRAEDYELFMRLYAEGYRGYNLQEELYGYLEEPDSYQKRKYINRVAECVVRWQGFLKLGILKGNLRYVVKPLFVGLIPGWMLRIQRKRRFTNNDRNCHIKLQKLERYQILRTKHMQTSAKR